MTPNELADVLEAWARQLRFDGGEDEIEPANFSVALVTAVHELGFDAGKAAGKIEAGEACTARMVALRKALETMHDTQAQATLGMEEADETRQA